VHYDQETSRPVESHGNSTKRRANASSTIQDTMAECRLSIRVYGVEIPKRMTDAERIDKLDDPVDRLAEATNEFVQESTRIFEEVAARFEQTDARFDQLTTRMDQTDKRWNQLIDMIAKEQGNGLPKS